MQEQWKDIVGYENLYKISNLGRVKSLEKVVYVGLNNSKKQTRKEKIKKLNTNKNGYLFTLLSKNGIKKYALIHKLVAQAFIPNPKNYNCINHKDENKQNNFFENLEWCSIRYNCNYGNRNKKISINMMGEKHKKSKKVLCVETGIIYNSTGEVERKIGIKSDQVRKCACGNKKSAHNLHFRYV